MHKWHILRYVHRNFLESKTFIFPKIYWCGINFEKYMTHAKLVPFNPQKYYVSIRHVWLLNKQNMLRWTFLYSEKFFWIKFWHLTPFFSSKDTQDKSSCPKTNLKKTQMKATQHIRKWAKKYFHQFNKFIPKCFTATISKEVKEKEEEKKDEDDEKQFCERR